CAGIVQDDNGAAHAAVANERVASEAERRERLAGRELAQERGEIIAIRGHVYGVAATTGTPGRVLRERLLLCKHAAQAAELDPHACCAAPTGGTPAPWPCVAHGRGLLRHHAASCP